MDSRGPERNITTTTDGPEERPSVAPPRRRWQFSLPLVVVVVGLLVTAALAVVSYSLYTRNEKRLLDLRARDLASVLMEALPNVQTPLATATAFAAATNGDPRRFSHLVAPYAGASPGHQFVSISLWRAGAAQRPIAVVGSPPILTALPSQRQAFFSRAVRSHTLSVLGLLQLPTPRLGYAVPTSGSTSRFIVYGESVLPANRRSRLQSNSAFFGLDYALYLGVSVRNRDLLVTSLSHPPIQGTQSKQPIPFGSTVLTLTVSSRHPLAGTFPRDLPWLIALVGIILTLLAAALTTRLIAGRRAAEDLAGRLERAVDENRRLYAEQRNIAQTLQHALLPDQLPQIEGAETSARYEPGEEGVEIGGDWYDVIPLDERRLLVVVGDVSGRGLQAAATMASLRYAIHAYAAQNDPPSTILTKLSRLLNVTADGQLATVLCAVVDVGARQLTITSAGHLPPLLISDGRGEFLEGEIGLPIGVQDGAPYRSTTVSAPPAATFIAFTDGLVERRGETLDQGLARLREVATANHAGLPDLLQRLASELRHEPSEDDTAIVGLRWNR